MWPCRLVGLVSTIGFKYCAHAWLALTHHAMFILFNSGPFLAILAALGGNYAAHRNKGPIGDSIRAVGNIAAAAGRKAQEERLLCKIKAAFHSLFFKDDCHHCAKQK